MAANITPLGLFSQVLLPNQPYELETLAADVQLTGISFGAEIAGENRASIKMTYFDRSTSNFGMGFDDSDDESDSDEEEYSEAAETDDDDDSGAVDEEALKKAIEEKSKKRNELLAAAAAAGVSPRKLAKGDASMDKSVAAEEDNSEGESDDDDSDMFDMSQDELKEVFIGNLLPGRIEQANINVFLAQGDTYEFQVTGENPVYLTGHYCETPRSQVNNGPDYGSDYGSEFDEDDLSESESGIYDPETGMPYADIDEDTDGERFEEIEAAAAAPAKKSKAEKKAKTVPAAAVEDLSMDMDAAPSTSAVDNTEGLSKNQKKKLKKQQAQAAAGGAKPEISSLEGKKTEAVSVTGEGKKTVSTSTEATVTADDTKAKAKKASKKTTLPSGLVLEDVKAGAGAAAKKGQKVSMRYIGKLQNGNIFDSNTKGKPFEFKLGAGQVIKGWDEGIAGMQPGGERRLTIPAKLAYGKSGTQGIPGNATLTFEVKLLSIK